MLSDGLAKNFDHQIREPVYSLWLVGEAWRGINHPKYFDHSFYFVETPESLPRRGE